MTAFLEHLRTIEQNFANIDAALAELAKPLSGDVLKWTCDEAGNWLQRPAHEIDGAHVPSPILSQQEKAA